MSVVLFWPELEEAGLRTDAGHGTDVSTLQAIYLRSDSGAALDTSEVFTGIVEVGDIDVGTGNDVSGIIAILATVESGVADDASAFQFTLIAQDTASYIEAQTLHALLSRMDQGHGYDSSIGGEPPAMAVPKMYLRSNGNIAILLTGNNPKSALYLDTRTRKVILPDHSLYHLSDV